MRYVAAGGRLILRGQPGALAVAAPHDEPAAPAAGPALVKPRTKFLIGGLIVLGSAGFLMASSIKETGQYYLMPSELAAKVTADPSFRNAGVKVGARVVPGSIKRDPGGRQLTFAMTDGKQVYNVAYRGIAPDTFTDGVDVVVEGRLDASNTFQATTLLAKCASRYENAPEKYRNAPGYTSGARA
jgi:cytochrome c-type biogenesis protein CcmE